MNNSVVIHHSSCSRRALVRIILRVVVASALLWLTPRAGIAQTRDRTRETEDPRTDRRQTETTTAAPAATPVLNVPPMEGTVDPDQYVVGPSDVFSVNVWTTPPLTLMLQVSPEGSLIVPSVGEVAVAGMTLAQAKKTVLERVGQRYLIGNPTMTLIRPRTVLVRIDGAVPGPGKRVMYATDRVDVAVREASGGVLTEQGTGQYLFLPVSTRHILLRRKDGTAHRVDIPLYYATKDVRLNPLLQEGDEVIVPQLKREAGAIGVYGGVNLPGRHEYVDGDSLTTALKLGFGLTYRADRDSIILARLDSSGTKMTEQYFSVTDLENGTIPNIPLAPGDRIFVREKTELRTDYRVWVTGEVRSPGRYPVTRNKTRLSDVIALAGGTTPYASLPSSQIFRTTSRPDAMQKDYLLSYRGLVAPDDSVNFLVEAALRLQREMVTVDFEMALVKHDSSYDVLLQSEDSVVVATALNTVYVFGQVKKPGHISLHRGSDADYYIEQAGGLTEHAKGGDVMVIKRSTGQALDADEAIVEDGDYVWVPMSPDRPMGYHLGIAAQAAAIITAAASVALVIISTR
jgi:polysaccharide biosynthesis/export protein